MGSSLFSKPKWAYRIQCVASPLGLLSNAVFFVPSPICKIGYSFAQNLSPANKICTLLAAPVTEELQQEVFHVYNCDSIIKLTWYAIAVISHQGRCHDVPRVCSTQFATFSPICYRAVKASLDSTLSLAWLAQIISGSPHIRSALPSLLVFQWRCHYNWPPGSFHLEIGQLVANWPPGRREKGDCAVWGGEKWLLIK